MTILIPREFETPSKLDGPSEERPAPVGPRGWSSASVLAAAAEQATTARKHTTNTTRRPASSKGLAPREVDAVINGALACVLDPWLMSPDYMGSPRFETVGAG